LNQPKSPVRSLTKRQSIMPTYDYECKKCDHRFEVFQSMKADRLTDCPLEECDGAVRRLIGTGAGIIFKGSGFYQTDYRSDSYKKAAKSESSAGSGEGGGGGKDTGSSSSSEKSGGSGSGSSSASSSSTSSSPPTSSSSADSGG